MNEEEGSERRPRSLKTRYAFKGWTRREDSEAEL